MNLVGQGFKVVRRGKHIVMYRREKAKVGYRWAHAMTKGCADAAEAEGLIQRHLEHLWYKEWK